MIFVFLYFTQDKQIENTVFYLKFSTTCLKMHFICKVSNCAHWKVQLCIDYPIFYSVSPSLSFFKLTKSSDDVC